jgi:hypothetical protein
MGVFEAGVARANITPVEAGLPTQLGGYGERNGAHALGVHDRIYAKALVLAWGDQKAALVSLDVTHAPRCLLEEAVALAAIPGLNMTNVFQTATHTHAGIEGFSMDRRNVFGNPRVGVFDQAVLDFVAAQMAGALREAHEAMEPAQVGVDTSILPGMNENRRDASHETDDGLTVLRIDGRDGIPRAVLFGYTAHGTLMTPAEMLVSGGWPGVAQRTVERLLAARFEAPVMALYANGAEGDVAPVEPEGGSRWEMAERYGVAVGAAAADLAQQVKTRQPEKVAAQERWVDLPPVAMAPDFMAIAGDEYAVTEEQLNQLMAMLLPARAPLCGLRIDDFLLITFPGEPMSAIGRAVKAHLRERGLRCPWVAPLGNEFVGYIMPAADYHRSGYEATASFYGPALGALLEEEAKLLGEAMLT